MTAADTMELLGPPALFSLMCIIESLQYQWQFIDDDDDLHDRPMLGFYRCPHTTHTERDMTNNLFDRLNCLMRVMSAARLFFLSLSSFVKVIFF